MLMARELNRELFGPRGGHGTETDVAATTPAPAYAKAEEVRVLHLHMETMARRMKEFESRVESMFTRVEDMTAQNKQRFERVQGHFQAQNEMLRNSTMEVHNKIAQVVSRLNERKISEGVVKEMVDRHANVVQTFETRLQQFQKVMAEQEMQLMHARSELKQALQELERLKKL
jgi:hypothetical protein